MKTKIAREFHWEMGHRLEHHQGLCRNIHGHSYRLWVEIEGEPDEQGMVMDYGDMKRIVTPVLGRLDHCFMCSESDGRMKEFFANTDFKVVYVPFETTAENIASYLLDKLWVEFGGIGRIESMRLRVCETRNTYAQVERSRALP
ncbi:MAG: 6-carboxytetrahydropterin synthase [Chlorobi bacterium]|nr:6-carboxytetrahydropterin synthase [Chlorobiota bacterium]